MALKAKHSLGIYNDSLAFDIVDTPQGEISHVSLQFNVNARRNAPDFERDLSGTLTLTLGYATKEGEARKESVVRHFHYDHDQLVHPGEETDHELRDFLKNLPGTHGVSMTGHIGDLMKAHRTQRLRARNL